MDYDSDARQSGKTAYKNKHKITDLFDDAVLRDADHALPAALLKLLHVAAAVRAARRYGSRRRRRRHRPAVVPRRSAATARRRCRGGGVGCNEQPAHHRVEQHQAEVGFFLFFFVAVAEKEGGFGP